MSRKRMDDSRLFISCLLLILSVVNGADEQAPQLITTENNNYHGYLDEFEGFQCQAKGTNLKYSWKHNDVLIDEKYILKFPVTNSSTLKPLPSNLDDSYRGSYQCFVTNSIGTIFGRKAYVEFTIVGDFLDKIKEETVNVDVGKPFSLNCPRHSISNNVKYNWFYTQADVPQPLPASNNSFVANNGTLYFSVLRDEDIKFIEENGGILCQQTAYVKGSKIRAAQSHLIKLKKNPGSGVSVPVKPKIETIVSDRTIFPGSDDVILKCGATGNPIPALKWYRVDSTSSAETEIVRGTDFKLERFNQFLTIKNVGSDKAGMYKCKAKNSVGEVEAGGRIKIAALPQWSAGGELGNVEPAIYSRLEWKCGASGGPSYYWYRNGVLLPPSSADGKVVVEVKKGISYLVIKNVTDAFNGMYQCTAENELDTIYSTGRLHVKEKKPEFTERMGPVTLIRSRTGNIICPVFGSPFPQITWRKDGRVILGPGADASQNDKQFKIASNGLDLLIPNVTDSDAGTYECLAKNRQGSAKDKSVARVGADISWKNAPVDNRNVTITLRYELDCEAQGDSSYEIKYRWLRNGLPLEYSARIHWVKTAHRLVILDALVSDTGTYTCIAFAETPLHIEKRKDVDIVVKAPADPPDVVRVKGSCWEENAKLHWLVGSLNNEVPYEYWIDWASSYNPTNWTRLTKVAHGTDNTETTLDFKLLPPFSQISFRVSVFNRIGPGEPSTPTDASLCITKPAAPPFSPSMIEGIPGKPNVLRLKWTPVPNTFWGAPGFNYSVQWRRKTRDTREERWLNLPASQDIRIYDGNNNSVEVQNPGYYNLWEFRIRSNNMKGSAKDWTYGESYSGQDAPKEEPTGLIPDRVTARSADISWKRLAAPSNGSIDGYRIKYWHSALGQDVEYDKNANLSQRAKRDLRTRTVSLSRSKRDLEAGNVARSRTKREDEDENVEKEDPYDICFNPNEPCSQDAAERESQLQELRPYREYHVRIAAFNSGGEGPWSRELIFTTAEAPPGQPYAVNTYAYDKYCKLTWKEPRHKNGIILQYQIYGNKIVRQNVSWWVRRHIIYELEPNTKYEAKIRARTASGWGTPVFRWFQTHPNTTLPAKPLVPEVVGYGEDGVNVTFMEPKPKKLRKFGGELDEDPWEYRPVGGYEMENEGVGGYPERFYVVYRRKDTNDKLSKTKMKQMYGLRDQTWIVIENLDKDTIYEFATVPVNSLGNGPRSDWAIALTGGIVPRVEKVHWYQRDWFIALVVLFAAAVLLLLTILCATYHIKSIYYEGAPKRRKDREREKIYEPEDVDGGFTEFTLKSARSSRSVVTSRSEAPPPYNSVVGSSSRHSGDFDDDEDATDSDEEKNEVSTYYSDEKKVPLDELDDDDEEDSKLATFV